MARAISVRLDKEALRALGQLEATGMTRSEAIRAALVGAASRLRDKELWLLRWQHWKPTKTTVRRCWRWPTSWRVSVRRGDVFVLRLPKGVGHEQRGRRLGVVVQSDAFLPVRSCSWRQLRPARDRRPSGRRSKSMEAPLVCSSSKSVPSMCADWATSRAVSLPRSNGESTRRC